jgi:hypothetical protein
MTHRKQKRSDKVVAKQLKSAQSPERADLTLGQTEFRLLAFQPLSLTLEDSRPFELSVQNIPCRFFLRPVHADENAQHTHGGTFIAVDFSLTQETDLLIATMKGVSLVEDFFSGVSLVEGATIRDVEPVQIVRAEPTTPKEYSLAHFLSLSMHHWDRPIPNTTIESVRGLLAHWDGLDSGKRLRRAARQYRKTIGTKDAIASFQHAYLGLEALEKPLADAIKIPPGVEVIQGKCEKCGAEYTRRRTVLAGVRACVCGEMHPGMATPERRKEWKEISEFRQKLFHSLEDIATLEQRAPRVLPAAMHFLHDAICCLSHAHTLESSDFRIRGMRQIVLVGRFHAAGLSPLEQWRHLHVKGGYWADHPQYGLVPRFQINNPGLEDLELFPCWLDAPIESASEENLVPANFESK